jgi:hypothetical protein
MLKALPLLIISLALASCASLPLIGGDSGEVFHSEDASFTLRLPSGWSKTNQAVWPLANRESAGRVYTLAKETSAKAGRNPEVVVREVLEPTPKGLLDFMAKDANLEFSVLWGVDPDKYRVGEISKDVKGTVLVYRLIPKDQRDPEYYGMLMLTGFGRLEVLAVLKAGDLPKYMEELKTILTSVQPASAYGQDLALEGYLAKVYQKALADTASALDGQRREAMSWIDTGQGLTQAEGNFMTRAYPKAVDKALSTAQVIGQGLVQGEFSSRSGEAGPKWQRRMEDLDEVQVALETIGLNLREQRAKAAVDKSAGLVKRLVALTREARKLPL